MGRLYKRNGVWQMDYIDLNGKRERRSTGQTKKDLAEKVLSTAENEILQHQLTGTKPESEIQFGEWAMKYAKEYSRTSLAGSIDKSSIFYNCNQLISFFGKTTRIKDLTLINGEEYKNKRMNEVKLASVNRELITLKAMFNKAFELGMLKEHRFQKLKLFPLPQYEKRVLELDEQRALEQAALSVSVELYKAIVIALEAGGRKMEILSRRMNEDFSLDEGMLKFQSYPEFKFNGHTYPKFNTKTFENRSVPMSDKLKELFKTFRHNRGPYFICHLDGSAYKEMRKGLRTASKLAGLKPVNWQVLRRTFANTLAKAGNDYEVVRKLMGHSKVSTTALNYAQTFTNSHVEAIQKLSKLKAAA